MYILTLFYIRASSTSSVHSQGCVDVEDPAIWTGSVYAHEVAKVATTAHLISGNVPSLKEV